METLFRLYNMILKHIICSATNDDKVTKHIEEGKQEGSLELEMEILLGLKWDLEKDNIIPTAT